MVNLKSNFSKILKALDFVYFILERYHLQNNVQIEMTINNLNRKATFSNNWAKVICNNLDWIAFETDMNGNCTWISDEWENKTGLGINDALNHGWRIGVIEEDRDLVLKEWKSAIDNKSAFDSVYRLVDRDGNTTKVRGIGLLVCDETSKDCDKNCYGYIGILKPI